MPGDVERRLRARVERTNEPVNQRFTAGVELGPAMREVDLDRSGGGADGGDAIGFWANVAWR